MDADTAVLLVWKLADAVARWQTGTCRGRRHGTAETEARAAAAKLLMHLTGTNPTTADVNRVLGTVGMV